MKIGGRGEISPEVLSANIDDVVAWTFEKNKQNDVYMLSQAASDSDKTAKRAGKKVDFSERSELDAKTMAGAAVKPRSVMRQLPTLL